MSDPRVEPCACGGVIVVNRQNDEEIRQSVHEHRQSLTHLEWLARQDFPDPNDDEPYRNVLQRLQAEREMQALPRNHRHRHGA